MPTAIHRPTIVLAPGGPGLGAETLASLPLPSDCKCLVAVSTCSPDDDPIKLQATRLIALIGAVPSSRNIVLIGHSAGAWAAIRAASQRWSNLAAVVLIGAQLLDRIDQPDLLRKRLSAADRLTRAYARHAQTLSSMTLPREDSVLLELLVADLALTLPKTSTVHRTFLNSCRRSWNVQAVRSLLAMPIDDKILQLVRHVQAPILVINGEQDPWASATSAMEIGDAAGNCIVEMIPDAGHAPWLDDPQKVGALLATTVEAASVK